MLSCDQKAKVFGIGWAKTGTTTLGCALSILGYQHMAQDLSILPDVMTGNYKKAIEIARSSDSFDDWPWILIYQKMDESFPGSKFILTVREKYSWLSSYRAMLEREGPPSEYLAAMRRLIYGFDVEHACDKKLIQRYDQHNRDVLEYFSCRPGQLLVVDWEKDWGWDRICTHLGVKQPCSPFPWMNRRSIVE